jgi:FMN-binding domain
MRRITFAIVSTIAAVVLLFSYRTSRGPAETAAAPPPTGGAQAGVVSGNDPNSAPPGTDPGAGTAPPNNGPVVVNGSVAQTEQGPVQVQVKIAGGRIVDVTPLQRPSGDQRHDEISAFSLPKLREQALAAQSAKIDGVSGATATSGGYRASLQSALDAANFA